MDKLSVHQGTKRSRQSQSKKKPKPIKVVYISNPMKVEASTASEFRALVQKFTGRDSDLSYHTQTGSGFSVDLVQKSSDDEGLEIKGQEYEHQAPQITNSEESSPGKSDDTSFEAGVFDDLFTSVLLDNFIY